MKKIHVLIFVLIGVALGGALGKLYYDRLFIQFLTTSRDYVQEDWNRMEYFSNKVVDHTIKLRKMFAKDGIKYDKEDFDAIVGTRSRILGADTLEQKAELLAELEDEINAVLERYNKDMKLRHDRFFYLEWGIDMKVLVHEYQMYRDKYRDTVNEYNFKVLSFPFKGYAKREGFKVQPLLTESKMEGVQVATERYTEKDLLTHFSEESPDSAGHGAH